MFNNALRAVALSLVVAAPAFAQIDQQQTSSNNGRYVNYNTGQSFTPSMNTSLGAGVLVNTWYYLDYTTQMKITLFAGGLPNNGGTEIASTTTTQFIGGGQTVWVDGYWNAPVTLVTGTKYYLTFLDSHDQTNAWKAEFRYLEGNNYAGGELLFAPNTDEGAAYSSIPGWDMAFHEFGENVEVESTPEPASLVLLGTGIIGLGIVRRRRTA